MTICLISPQEFLTAQNALAPFREAGSIISLKRNDVNVKSLYNIAARFQDLHDATMYDMLYDDNDVRRTNYLAVDTILCAALNMETSGDTPLRNAFYKATYADLGAAKIDIICKALYADAGIHIGVLHTDEKDRKDGSITFLKAVTDKVIEAKRLSDMRDHSYDGSAIMCSKAHQGYLESYDIIWNTVADRSMQNHQRPAAHPQDTARILEFSR